MLYGVAGRGVEVMPFVGAEMREAVRARLRVGIVPVGHDDRREPGVVEDGQERQALGARRAHPVHDDRPALPAPGNEPRGRQAEGLVDCDRAEREVLGGPWVEPALAHRQAMRHEKR